MILGLVFSKDRALQLEACLSSLFRHAEGLDGVSLQVIYRGSSERHLRQYRQLAGWFSGRAEFVQEVRFREAVLEGLRRAAPSTGTSTKPRLFSRLGHGGPRAQTPENTAGACVVFIVDDTVFVQRLDPAAWQSTLEAHPGALGFSLRLGRNTTESYAFARRQAVPEFLAAGEGCLLYDWTKADGDFGYPLEVSSSMYRLSDILPVVERLDFQDPNMLESRLSQQAKRFARKRPEMLCPERSVAFSAPLNRVQAVFENRSGVDPRWSAEQLADKFDQGLRIDVARFDDFTPSACHQEVELSFEPRG